MWCGEKIKGERRESGEGKGMQKDRRIKWGEGAKTGEKLLGKGPTAREKASTHP